MSIFSIKQITESQDLFPAGGAPQGYDAFLTAEFLKNNPTATVVFLARDERRMETFAQALRFFMPTLKVLVFPPWDCLPYDRISPSRHVSAQRLETLTALSKGLNTPFCVVTTITAWSHYIVPPTFLQNSTLVLKAGAYLPQEEIIEFCRKNGYQRVETVRDYGEYAIRGGILDIFPASQPEPLRLDFFGDTLEHLRFFDPLTQRTSDKNVTESFQLGLVPVSEIFLNDDALQHFRQNFKARFGTEATTSSLYTAITQGKIATGQEHWLPLFYEEKVSLKNYIPHALEFFDHLSKNALAAHQDRLKDYYHARHQQKEIPYYPVPPSDLYQEVLTVKQGVQFSPFLQDSEMNMDGKTWTFTKDPLDHIQLNPPHLMAFHSAGSRDRAQKILESRGMTNLECVGTFILPRPGSKIQLVILPLTHGFISPALTLATEEDVFGERLVKGKGGKPTKSFTLEFNNFQVGDFLVHQEHGVGQFMGLINLEIGNAFHDCLQLVYAKGDKLFVPVENIDVLSLYSSDQEGATLDHLGSVAWQNRKARVKERITALAHHLMQLAALRKTQVGLVVPLDHHAYEAFCQKFPYAETDDQLHAIEDILNDFMKGIPADRLICGDVGFGKTEVAMRAAFIMAAAGYQVVIVAPTTILSRQHYESFHERFKGFPFKIGHISRLQSPKERQIIQSEIEAGDLQLIIATHSIFSDKVKFKNLGLVIIDEEQHFGVEQKEILKKKYPSIHMLSLSATPIPRTLQMSMSGIRDISLITTPPVDRLPSHTFVGEYDPLIIREAIMREIFRGGQTFYVCPRIADIPKVKETLEEIIPDAKIAVGHGKLPPKELDHIMHEFMAKNYDVLISTSIVESGLDIPTANTLIVHKADMFGLSQLYQLRGRVGRSKTRGYAHFTTTSGKTLNPIAHRRLEVIQSLDSLGAGFAIASHDLDIRGAGNLVGEEQSGQIKEVGVALYQHMLEEAVLNLQENGSIDRPQDWSPQLNLGLEVLIPESYVADLNLRLSLYRQASSLKTPKEIQGFSVELIDRFGPLPDEVENLLKVIILKNKCKELNIAKIDIGTKGALISFYKDECPYTDRLVAMAQKYFHVLKLRPDHKVALGFLPHQQGLGMVNQFMDWIDPKSPTASLV